MSDSLTWSALQQQLTALSDEQRANVMLGFFKTGPGQYGEGDRFRGISLPKLRALTRQCAMLPRAQIIRLLKSPWHDDRMLALLVLVRQYARGAEDDRHTIYRLYLDRTDRINNWDLVDVTAPLIVGRHLESRDRAPLYELAVSESLWERRIAIISTAHFIRRQNDFRDTLRIAKILLHDRHDLIHKAVGWMLREVGNRDRAAECAFLDRDAARMPRTMLRYAIEKFPPALRRKYMTRA